MKRSSFTAVCSFKGFLDEKDDFLLLYSLHLKKKLLFPIRARSPLICQFSNSSVHEYLKFEIAEYKKVSYGSEIVFRRTLVQKHFFTRNWQKPPVADAGTRHFANCFLMAKSASLWSLKAPEQKVICAVESNWFPIVLGAGNWNWNSVVLRGVYRGWIYSVWWLLNYDICAHFCKWKGERYFGADDILITSSCSSD